VAGHAAAATPRGQTPREREHCREARAVRRAPSLDGERESTGHAPSWALNRNHARRDELLGTAHVRYSGGIKPFAGLAVDALAALFAERFVDPACRQNEGPAAGDVLRFIQRWPCVTARGYAVSRRREDYRVSLDGLECDLRRVPAAEREKLRAEFALFCRGADEYSDDAERLFAWWD
jgi:hypothetical protein